MWVLVVVLFSGGSAYSYAENVPYDWQDDCWIDAQNTYNELMATKPDDKAYVVAYCSEVPKGV